jgi:hypothetical protein
VVGAQGDFTDKLLGFAEDTLSTQHSVAQIAKSLLQTTHCEIRDGLFIFTNRYYTTRVTFVLVEILIFTMSIT